MPDSLSNKVEWVQSYLAWLSATHPQVADLIAYVDILDDGSLNFVTHPQAKDDKRNRPS